MTSNKIAGVGVAGRPEHAHQALGRLAGQGRQFLEPDGGVDVVTQNDLANFKVSGKQALNTFL